VKGIIKLGFFPFGLALGLGVAYRLSAEAMAVVVGVFSAVIACTVMGGVILVIIRATNQRASSEQSRLAGYPPVMFVQPTIPGQFAHNQTIGMPFPSYTQAPQRSFSIVGEDGEY
jgi:hypothetical protein